MLGGRFEIERAVRHQMKASELHVNFMRYAA
jgi:hypothetical protein